MEKPLHFYIHDKFPTTDDVVTELINLEAIQQLPKGTELYVSDIHGEYEGFDHMLRIGSGILKEKISELFMDELGAEGVERLTLIVAYPKVALKCDPLFQSPCVEDIIGIIEKIIRILRYISSKYTRSKLRKALPDQYRYVTEELLYADYALPHKKEYALQIMRHLFELDIEEDFIVELCDSIQKLAVDHLHVVGDIYDRGSDADRVMDRLLDYPSVDIQWGNHDIIWIGAYYGSAACLLTLLRIAARYQYIFDIERSYGINLRPLFSFAKKYYQANPAFTPCGHNVVREDQMVTELEQVHQALAIMQFKLEDQLLARRPEFKMNHRRLLECIDYGEETITIDGEIYPLAHTCFQLIDPDEPGRLTPEENEVIESLMYSFQHSDKMGKHIEFMVKNGSMYRVYNNHLLYHGCLPLTDAGELLPLEIRGQSYSGQALLDFFDECVRIGASSQTIYGDFYTDLFWYLWTGPYSPLFGKEKMTTFERYFIEDPKTHYERKNAYYDLREREDIAVMILEEFGLTDPRSAIINGHTPVRARKGEAPVKAKGRLFVIDGGLSKAYQGKTGIAGYSLINNSYGFQIVTHQAFTSVDALFQHNSDGTYIRRVIEKDLPRIKIYETTIGSSIADQIRVLQKYLRQHVTNERKYRRRKRSQSIEEESVFEEREEE